MYLEYYSLLRPPFEMTPDPAFLYLGEAHREGLATLVYGVRARKGFLLLSGEVGTGKTTLLHALLAQLPANVASAFVFNPKLEPLDFFRMLLDEYGIEEPCETKADYLLALNRFLIGRLEKDEPVLLIIDEAQLLSPELLEEIRLLSNLETSTSKLIQIMLVGQPELKDLLARPELRQLRQRIVLRHHLRPFDPDECASYIQERLRLAGYTGKGIFKRSALKAVHEVTGGIPRLVNVVCDGGPPARIRPRMADARPRRDPGGGQGSGTRPGRRPARELGRRSRGRAHATRLAARSVPLRTQGRSRGSLDGWRRFTMRCSEPRSSGKRPFRTGEHRGDGAPAVGAAAGGDGAAQGAQARAVAAHAPPQQAARSGQDQGNHR